MPDQNTDARRFRVQARHVDSHHARIVEEPSFEAAAVAYLEDYDLQDALDDEEEVIVVVHDIESGHERRFAFAPDRDATARPV